MRICVIGAGIVGCATAYRLARDGFQVTLLDAEAGPGLRTSHANGAQLSYSYVEPFASPGTLRALPKMLLSADSPVRFGLRADPRQWAWSARFLLACRRDTARAGTAALLALAKRSRAVLDEWRREEAWAIAFTQHGKLVLCADARSLAAQRAQVALQAGFGCAQAVVDAARCRDIEPALRTSTRPLAGGVWTADECVADPHRLCTALVESLRHRGGCVRLSTRVDGLRRDGVRFNAAITSAGDIAADAFVLAAGPQSAALARAVGVTLPIWPIRGYSVTLPFLGARRPRVSVTDLGLKTVFTPLGDRLRVAAMAEIDGDELTIPPDRIETMLRSVGAVYPGVCDLRSPEPWAGLRPATPDSRPLIRREGRTNLFINAGHGGLGLTLAAGSAAQVSDEVARYARA